MTRVVLLAIVAAIGLSGCGGDEPAVPSPSTGQSASAGTTSAAPSTDSAAAPCDEVLVPGVVLTQDVYDNGCRDGDVLNAVGGFDCADGRKLYGNGRQWAFVGQPIVEVSTDDVASDPAYGAAYQQCMGS